MRAVTWHGKRDVRVDTVPDPTIEKPTDAIVRITSTGICGSDLHLYEVLGPFMGEGDILGHEPMGIVEEVGAEVTHIAKGDRVVIPFNISCGSCFMCDHGSPRAARSPCSGSGRSATCRAASRSTRAPA
jgi:threonine dehydrogenase-like Zn-dependent dehydrogenase